MSKNSKPKVKKSQTGRSGSKKSSKGKPSRPKRRDKESMKAVAVPALAIILLVILTLDFSSSRLKPVRDEVTRTNQQVEMLRKQAIQGQAVLANPAVTDAENAAALARMPSEPQLAAVIDQVDRLARDNKLNWTAGAPAPSPITDASLPGSIRAWSMGATFTGPVSGIYAFLDKLDTLERVVTIETVSMQQSGGVYTASAVLRFYAMGE